MAREHAQLIAKETISHDAKKEAEVKAVVTVQEVVKQIEVLLAPHRNAIRMPRSVQRDLNRAIAARRRFSAWYEASNSPDDISNENHQFFIDVLQKAFDHLAVEENGMSARGQAGSALTFVPIR